MIPLLPLSASAVELELQENRVERGNIGYVDMQRIFKAYPETKEAQSSFDEIVEKTEEQVNLQKADILRLRNKIAQMKVEREFLAQSPIVVSSVPAISASAAAPPIAMPSSALPLPATQPPAASSAAVSAATVPAAPPVQLSESSAAPAGLKEMPGLSAASPKPATTTTTTAPPVPPSPPPIPQAPPPSPQLVALDENIAKAEEDLAKQQSDFKSKEAAAEKNLLALEKQKTELLLGRIYQAIREVAHAQGVSVVVDKSMILFGHDAVDLTDKVLDRLAQGSETPKSL